MTQNEYTARAIKFLTQIPNLEAPEHFPRNSMEPVIISLETFHRLATDDGDTRNRILGYRGPILLTLPAALYIMAESHNK